MSRWTWGRCCGEAREQTSDLASVHGVAPVPKGKTKRRPERLHTHETSAFACRPSHSPLLAKRAPAIGMHLVARHGMLRSHAIKCGGTPLHSQGNEPEK